MGKQLDLQLSVNDSVTLQQDLARCEAWAQDVTDENTRLTAANAKLQKRVDRLQEALRKLEKQHRWLTARYARLRDVMLEDTKHPLYVENADLKRHVEELRQTVRFWVRQAEGKGWRFDIGARSTQANGLGKDTLTTLLTLAHPDKWSQGQPAAELAHELSVIINKLREGSTA